MMGLIIAPELYDFLHEVLYSDGTPVHLKESAHTLINKCEPQTNCAKTPILAEGLKDAKDFIDNIL